MKSNKEYHFKNNIESVADVVEALRDAGYVVSLYRKCDFDNRTIAYRLIFCELEREYQVIDLDDCLKMIVNDAVMLGNMTNAGSIVES